MRRGRAHGANRAERGHSDRVNRSGQGDRAAGGTDQGAATVMVVACLGLLLVLGAALGAVAGVVVDHRRGQAAADLAALAGAAEQGRGRPACAAAERIARSNGAEVTSCQVAGMDVSVEVRRQGPPLLGVRPWLTARARAGPADVVPPG